MKPNSPHLNMFLLALVILVIAAGIVAEESESAPLSQGSANIIFVDQGAAGANDGTSWVDAITDLQDALAIANYGSEIWVAEGIYKSTNDADRSATFLLKNGVGPTIRRS
jgi:hypothetical protein